MIIVRPLPITDARITSTNVAQADYAAYNAGTTYALGDRVIVISPTAAVTITIAPVAVVTWTAHGQGVGTPLTFSTTGALPSGITAGTLYYVKAVTADTFTLAATSGGVEIGTSGTQSGVHTALSLVHRIYESLQAANLAHYPLIAASATWWVYVGDTNRWKMFDGSISSQTSNLSTIDVTFATSGRVNSVVLMNVNAASVRIVMTDAIDGVVYDATTSLVSDSGITDWYAYYFEPIERIADYAVVTLPPYNNATIRVLLTDTGNTVLCGACVLGLSKDIGTTQYGMSVGIQDYSIKQRDSFGNYSILQRAFNKRADMQVWVDGALVDKLQTLLASYRALPVVYIGTTAYGSSIVYGFYKDFTVSVAYPTKSICNMTIEGLT